MIPVIQMFAKAPVVGRVKTRLQPVVSAEDAAELYHSFVADALEWLGGFKSQADIELHVDGLTDAWREFPYRRVFQADGNIGDRMLAAAESAFGEGRRNVVILGSDSPNLPALHLQEMLDPGVDVAFGPSEDGGFWGISLCQTHPQMFEGVQWSTEFALAQSVEACERCGLSVAFGREWFDVDSPADLVKLVTHPTPPRTTAWLERHQFLIERRNENI